MSPHHSISDVLTWNVWVNIFIDNKHQNMVAHLLFELLAVSATYGDTATRALGSTNFTMVPTWNISNWLPTFSFGVKALLLLQVQRIRAMD